jgi:hypothetical protein
MVGFYIFLNYLTLSLVLKVLNYPMVINFLINKVKNKGKFLFTSCLPSINMGVSSPKSRVVCACVRPSRPSRPIWFVSVR